MYVVPSTLTIGTRYPVVDVPGGPWPSVPDEGEDADAAGPPRTYFARSCRSLTQHNLAGLIDQCRSELAWMEPYAIVNSCPPSSPTSRVIPVRISELSSSPSARSRERSPGASAIAPAPTSRAQAPKRDGRLIVDGSMPLATHSASAHGSSPPLLGARELANPYTAHGPATCWEYGAANCALEFDAVNY